MTKEQIKNIIELFISWNDENMPIDVANIDIAVDYIHSCQKLSLQSKVDREKLDELAESMSKGFWSDDLESFEDNPQRDLILWVAKRIYEGGIKNGYRKAKEEQTNDS